MKVVADMVYLGFEDGTSRDGNTFTVVGLLQGLDSQRIFVSDVEVAKEIKKLAPNTAVKAFLNLSIGRDKTFINIDHLEAVK